jgi:hypothetical protein
VLIEALHLLQVSSPTGMSPRITGGLNFIGVRLPKGSRNILALWLSLPQKFDHCDSPEPQKTRVR